MCTLGRGSPGPQTICGSSGLAWLHSAGSGLNVGDQDGHTPLHIATAHQHLGCVRMLLELGADIGVATR